MSEKNNNWIKTWIVPIIMTLIISTMSLIYKSTIGNLQEDVAKLKTQQQEIALSLKGIEIGQKSIDNKLQDIIDGKYNIGRR